MKTALRLSSVVVAILTFPQLAAAQLETIDFTARGTGTQLGHTVSIKLIITRYSTPEDRQTLVNAFKQGQQRGLASVVTPKPAICGHFKTGHFAPTPRHKFRDCFGQSR